MGIADSEQPSALALTNAHCAEQMKVVLADAVKRTKRQLNRISTMLSGAPGGAQGCVDALTAGEYTEVANMIDDLEAFHNDHKKTGDANITVTVPTQTP